VEVVASTFEPVDLAPPAFYEQPWFAMVVRYGAALLAVLLVLLFAVRPLIGKRNSKGKSDPAADPALADAPVAALSADGAVLEAAEEPAPDTGTPLGDLPRQVELARQLAASQPERAVEALQRMLESPEERAA
jgi:flagellar M-ring protein FliF